MKYEIIDTVSRFSTRFGMIMDPETMNKARDEAEEYDFREISEGHYAVRHGKKMYVLIERDGEIGCSCDAMTFNRMDGSACKHIIAFTRLMSPVTKKIDEADATHLRHVCGWTGEELHPEVELGGPGAVVQEDTTPKHNEPERKIYTRRCKHCDEVYSGQDLDAVKKELSEHVKVCGMNPRAKPHKQEPDPKDKDPASERKKYPDDHERTCQYCGMSAARKYQSIADAWLKKHEASCPKNPANKATSDPDGESNEGEDPIPPGEKPPKPQEKQTTALSTGREFPDQREFTNKKVRRHVENRGGFYKNQKGEEVPDSAAMSLYALDTCRISTETILIEKNTDQAKAIVRGHKGGVSIDASVILRFDVLKRRELLKMAKKYPKSIMNWTEEMIPILDLNFMLKDKTPVVTLGEHMFNFAIDQEQFSERTAETLARRRVFDMLSGVDWRDDVEVQVEDADAASMGSKKR
jgi:hypothetical protein